MERRGHLPGLVSTYKHTWCLQTDGRGLFGSQLQFHGTQTS